MNPTFSDRSPKFSIAIVNYKTLELTKICLDLLKKHLDNGELDKNRVDIWVVDNHSQDSSVEYLRMLDWINLIERVPDNPEEGGYEAHGKGLDVILEKITTNYLFILHTDTFIYDAGIFDLMLVFCNADINTAVVGCLHQVNRGYLRTTWRTTTRFLQYYSRKSRLYFGFNARCPQFYMEEHIKSFCALWNAKLVKQCGYSFFMGDCAPCYEMQDKMVLDGYKVKPISPIKVFKYLDHCEAGTVSLRAGYSNNNRRVKRKNIILEKINSSNEYC